MSFFDQTKNIGNPHHARHTDKDDVNHGDGHVIHFFHIASRTTCHFAGYITDYKDSYVQNWNTQTTHGRMDPIATFKNTQRKITLAWDVPASSVEEAKYNLLQAEILMSMQYPSFEEINVNNNTSLTTVGKDAVAETINTTTSGSSRELTVGIDNSVRNEMLQPQNQRKNNKTVGIMASAPLIKIKFDNLVKNSESDISANDADSPDDGGLVGFVDGFTFAPDLEVGWFGSEIADGVPVNNLVPKLIHLSCNFTVLHTTPHGLGFRTHRDEKKGIKRDPQFPYGAKTIMGYKKVTVR